MDKKKQDLLNSIRMDIKKYWDIYSTTPYDPNNPKIPLHSPTFGPDEVMSMIEVMLSTQVTMGEKVRNFESEIGNYFGVSEVVTANSGSSANLLAIAALTNPATSDGLKSGDEVCDRACLNLYYKLETAGLEPVYDDRVERAGAKFADMDLIGIPWQIIVGPRGIKNGVIELKHRASGEREELSEESVLARLLP